LEGDLNDAFSSRCGDGAVVDRKYDLSCFLGGFSNTILGKSRLGFYDLEGTCVAESSAGCFLTIVGELEAFH
jgi:hypothetical protein